MKQRDDASKLSAKPHSPRGWRVARHVGLAPLVLSLGVALLVAGSITLIEVARNRAPGSRGGSAGTADGQPGAGSVPLDSLDLDVDRPVDPASAAPERPPTSCVSEATSGTRIR